MKRFLPITVAAALLLPGVVPVRSQQPTFSADSELVVLHVTIKDKRGAYVGGLAQEAFHVIEDGQPQDVRVFSDTDTPATIGLLIDASGSMHQYREVTIASAAAFARASHADDEIFALAFNEYVIPVLSPSSPFTNSGDILRAALVDRLPSRGRTALYDAISAGVDYLARGIRERKVLVMLSDGGDNASRTTREHAIQKAQTSNAVIYTVGLIEPGSRDANPELLKALAMASGGEAFRPKQSRGIAATLHQIAQDVRHTYTIGYTPKNTARDGAFRTVRVVVDAPPGRPLIVRSRTGYLAGTPKAK